MERVPAAAPQALTIGCPEDLAPVGEALSALDIGLTLVDRDLRIQWANDWVRRAAVELTCGASHCFTALWQETRRCSDCLPVLVFGTGEPREGVRERGRPGEPREAFRVRAVPVRDGSGQVRWVAESFVRLSGMGLDLAGRRADALDEAAAGAALVVVDREERIVSWGGAAAAIFGYALEEALGRRVDLIVPPGREAEESALAARVEAEGRAPRMETERRARDGRLVPVALTASAVRDESGRLVGRSCLVEDLSALHRLRDQVAAQDQLLAHITREAADAILGVDRQGTVTSWNRGAERLLGLTAAQVVGRPLATVARPDDVERLLHQAGRSDAVRGLRMVWTTAGGERAPVDVSAVALAGEREGLALVARDASARQRLERQMMRSEKLAVVGSLAAGLAHEIGTPLNVISATAEYLMLDGGDERERLQGIVDETERISRLVRELLTFARGSVRGRAPVHLPQAADRVLSLLRIPMERKGVRLDLDLPADLPPVDSEQDGVHQILLNLLLNALAAVSEGGRIGVRGRRLPGDGGAPLVSIEVHDDGPGVPEALRERIFDPFFTTRPDGTGLGLAVCARVVATHGGDIRVAEGPLGGACFVVQLPAAEAP